MVKKNKNKPKKQSKNQSNKITNKELFAFIAAFFTIIGFILAIILKKDDKYIMYYANQGLILFFGQLIISGIGFCPIANILTAPLWILWVILWIYTWISAFSGKTKSIFIISDFAKMLKLKN